MNEENNTHQDPNNWKLGFFYFNPKDKRVFVLKRIPFMGITLNFGNPCSAVILAAFIILMVFLSRN